MENYKSPLIILGLILIIAGSFLFNPLRFWAIIALIVGFIALIKAFTITSDIEKGKEIKEEPEEESENEENPGNKEPADDSEKISKYI